MIRCFIIIEALLFICLFEFEFAVIDALSLCTRIHCTELLLPKIKVRSQHRFKNKLGF